MPLNAALDHAEDLAEAGDIPAALLALEAARTVASGRGAQADVAVLTMEIGAMTARAGDLEDALPLLQLAQALATAAAAPLTAAEALVTHCSVLGALGRFDEALPALRHAVAELSRIAPGGELHTQAKAELSAFSNLTSPKNAATWAALLDKS